ncbi:MAG: cytochrome b5-like heme/steroid binding domain-containing protein [bacterium]
MKKFTGISLFIFFCVVSAILTAGLVFFQNNNNNTNTNKTADKTADIPTLVSTGIKTLNTIEVAKHNTVNDCWIIVNNKVYDISGYASSHPGGSRNITNYCGKESTQAFNTKGGQGSPHSGGANNMLAQDYVGDLNQKIDQKTIDQNVQKIKASSASTAGQVSRNSGDDSENDD